MKSRYVFYGILILLLPTIFASSCFAYQVKLTSGLIKLLDGVTGALDGNTIRNMLIVRGSVRKIQYGVENKKTKTVEGLYFYNNKNCSLAELVEYEKQQYRTFANQQDALDQCYLDYEAYQAEWIPFEQELKLLHQEELTKLQEHTQHVFSNEKLRKFEEAKLQQPILSRYQENIEQHQHTIKHKHIRNQQAYMQEWKAIKNELDDKTATLQDCLRQAQEDFRRATNPFMEQARGVKPLLLKLIEESCYKRGRLDSFLLDWGKAKEYQEHEQFVSQMVTCQRLYVFCTDLTNFIEDMINSCPKGWKQFLELSAQQKHDKSISEEFLP